jgi:hypothetical protein
MRRSCRTVPADDNDLAPDDDDDDDDDDTNNGRHYRFDVHSIPFVLGAATTPSHNVNSNVQKVNADNEHRRSLALCLCVCVCRACR